MDATNMATGKGPTPLFEVLRGSDKSGGGKLSLPNWAKPGHGTAASSPASQSTESTTGPASEGTPGRTEAASQSGPGVSAWMRNPVRVSRAAIVAGVSLAIALLALGGMLMHHIGYVSGQGETQNYQASVKPVEKLRELPATPLIPSTVLRVQDTPGGNTVGPVTHGGTAATAGLTLPATGGAVAAGTEDPRQPGLNYFRLTVLPVAAVPEAEKIVAFLGKNGVDAAVIPVQNGKAVKVVALQGFAKPVSDPAAKQYGEHLKSLGRQWRATQKGSSDWKDMFPEKYLPSKN